jgi:hypothetical protein
MCLSYKISGFVLVAVMITRIQCGTGDAITTIPEKLLFSFNKRNSTKNPNEMQILFNYMIKLSCVEHH